MVGLVYGYDRLSSAEFGHVFVFRSSFHVRSSCITLYLSTSHKLDNQNETWGNTIGWGTPCGGGGVVALRAEC